MKNLTEELTVINGGFVPDLQAVVDYLQDIQDAIDYLNSLNGTSDDYHG